MNNNDDNEIKNFGPHLVILSAERTLLSWLRLALTLMSVGFVLDRFGLFIRAKDLGSNFSWLPKSYSFIIGIGLVIAGSLTSAVAGLIYSRFRVNYTKKEIREPKGSRALSIFSSLIITLIGIITAIFLITISD